MAVKDEVGALEQAADAARVRPRIEAAAGAERPLRDPHLLERRPVVRRALPAQEIRAVALLERQIHLQAAVVRTACIPPRALVALETAPRGGVGRVLRA